jgi:vitamin B12 transporter
VRARPRASIHFEIAILLGVLWATAAARPAVAQTATQATAAAADTPAPESEAIEEYEVRGFRARGYEGSPSALGTHIATEGFVGEQKRLEDMLATQIGVHIRRFGGPGDPATISIRGSAANQVTLLLDGVPMNSALTGSADVSVYCTDLIDGIGIARSGAAPVAGGGAIGGVVEFESRRPGAEAINRARVSGGAFGTVEGSVLRTAQVGELEYGLGYCGFRTQGNFSFARLIVDQPPDPPVIERINNEQVRHSGTLSLGGELGRFGHLAFSDYVTYASRGEPGLASLNDPQGGQNPNAHSWDTRNLARLDWRLEEAGLFGDLLRATLYHRYERNQLDDPGRTALDPHVAVRTQTNRIGFVGRDRWALHALAADHDIDFNLDVGHDALHADDRDAVRRTDLEIALQDSAAFFDRRLTLVPGVRMDWAEGFGASWLPSVGLVVSPVAWLDVVANANRSYRVPNFNELFYPDKGYIRGNPDLDPEDSINFDAGLELGPFGFGLLRDLRLTSSVFLQEIDESIVWMKVSPFTVMPVNTGEARVRGVEVALAFGLTDYLRLSGNYTKLDAESTNTGLPLVGRPDAEAYARIELGPRDHFKLTGELEYSGEIFVSPGGALRIGARSVWNASAAWNLARLDALGLDRFVDSLWIHVTLNNLSDVAVRDLLFAPQPGRAGYIGVEVAL